VVVSRWSESHARNLLKEAQIQAPLTVLSNGDKGKAITQYLGKHHCEQSFFVDDKPKNLESVKRECGDRVRVIGFVGSRKYTGPDNDPRLAEWCAQNGAELALSAIDLCEGLPVGVDSCAALFHSEKRWNEEELAGLLAGSDHPFSTLAGEGAYVDHRAAQSELFGNRKVRNFDTIWRNIAWITCNECLWKALVVSLLKSLSLDPRQVLGEAYKHDEYTQALKDFAAKNRQIALSSAFGSVLRTINQGIAEIGVEAETCRIYGRQIERDRIKKVEERLNEVFGGRERCRVDCHDYCDAPGSAD
jgi:hypothetical protein